MSAKSGLCVLPPYAVTLENANINVYKGREGTYIKDCLKKGGFKPINELRLNIPNWYNHHKKLEGLFDEIRGFPQEIPPTTSQWKHVGIPSRCPNPFFSHTPFSKMYLENDRRRKDPDTGCFALGNNARYGLEEVYYRNYCARKDLNPFLQREKTATSVKKRILTKKNADYFNAEKERLLGEIGARNFKSSAPFHCQRDSLFVTQAGDLPFKAPELCTTNANKLSILNRKSDIKIRNEDPKSNVYCWENESTKEESVGSRMFEKSCVLQAKKIVDEYQKATRNVITRGVDIRSGDVEKLEKMMVDDEIEGEEIGYIDIPTEKYMKDIGVGGRKFKVKSYKETLLNNPGYTREILAQERDICEVLMPAPLYHPMLRKTQLNRDFHNIYPDPLPRRDLCTSFKDTSDMNRKFGHYRPLDADSTALKLKWILK